MKKTMDQNNKTRRVIIISLAGLLIGTLLFIFGLSIKDSIWPLIANYIIGMVLYICSFLAVYNNNKTVKQAIYKYIMALVVVMVILITFATLSRIF